MKRLPSTRGHSELPLRPLVGAQALGFESLTLGGVISTLAVRGSRRSPAPAPWIPPGRPDGARAGTTTTASRSRGSPRHRPGPERTVYSRTSDRCDECRPGARDPDRPGPGVDRGRDAIPPVRVGRREADGLRTALANNGPADAGPSTAGRTLRSVSRRKASFLLQKGDDRC